MKKKQTSKNQESSSAAERLRAAAEGKRGGRPLTARGVAELCGVELKTVHNWTMDGLIPHFRTPGRHLRFQAEAVIQFLEQCGFQVPEAGGSQNLVALAKGTTKSRISKVAPGTLLFADDEVSLLIAIGRAQPNLVLLDHSLLKSLPLKRLIAGLKKASPETKIIVLGTERVASVLTVDATDSEALAAALHA